MQITHSVKSRTINYIYILSMSTNFLKCVFLGCICPRSKTKTFSFTLTYILRHSYRVCPRARARVRVCDVNPLQSYWPLDGARNINIKII